MKNNLIAVSVFVVIFCLDFFSKFLVLQNIKPFEVVPVIDNFFNLTLAMNKGVAFGISSNFPDIIRKLFLATTSILALGVLVWVYFKYAKKSFLILISLAMILAGASGNIVDRLRFGAVVDFLDFYINQHHWPAFNVADSAICVGVVILIFFAKEKTV